MASISGGSDSDVMMDVLVRCGGKEKTHFIFFNTGLEYEATKKQLDFLREKYEVEIEVVPPIKPIPLCVRQHGFPFWNKHVSEMIERLQRHNFQWEDEPLDTLIEKYPKVKSALKWWCNAKSDLGKRTSLDIGAVPWLKEFLIANPPKIPISSKCCSYAKKEPAKRFLKSGGYDLACTGLRQAEGGVRAAGIKNCYSQNEGSASQYRPVWWFKNDDKKQYVEHYGITHSECYSVWGMTRTGCAGCPLTKNWEKELALAKKYEPKFYKAMVKTFGPSYEYRQAFEKFRKEKKEAEQ
jgi:3'-phosphoadenosine 5'-phosphosulfate sulfotransferase (PAPS reductase)/FAD synthetase